MRTSLAPGHCIEELKITKYSQVNSLIGKITCCKASSLTSSLEVGVKKEASSSILGSEKLNNSLCIGVLVLLDTVACIFLYFWH